MDTLLAEQMQLALLAVVARSPGWALWHSLRLGGTPSQPEDYRASHSESSLRNL